MSAVLMDEEFLGNELGKDLLTHVVRDGGRENEKDRENSTEMETIQTVKNTCYTKKYTCFRVVETRVYSFLLDKKICQKYACKKYNCWLVDSDLRWRFLCRLQKCLTFETGHGFDNCVVFMKSSNQSLETCVLLFAVVAIMIVSMQKSMYCVSNYRAR